MNWFSWLFILIPVMRIVNGQGKLLRMATKERLNQESMMILQQKQMMMMYKYQQLMQLKMPLEQLKRVNNFNKWNIANLQRENNEFKMQIVHLQQIVHAFVKIPCFDLVEAGYTCFSVWRWNILITYIA
eukprot:1094511_1